MFRWLIGTSLQYRALILGAAAALVALGALQLRRMPVDVFPEFAPPIVQVQTEALGLSAEEVQDLITLNLEELLSGVPWLKSIRSESVTGLSSIVMTFERGTDIMKARQMIQERLTLAYTLPNVAQPPVILQPLSATSRLMIAGVSSATIEPAELSLLARWTVKPRLLGVPGVANVAIWGQRLRQLHVQIDPDRLRDARVMQDEVIAAAGDALWVSPLSFLKGSSPGTGGWIDNRNQRLGLQHEMPIVGPEDMAKVALAASHLLLSGKRMTLGEVAETSFSHPPLIGDAVIGGGQGLLLVIEKSPSANTLEVTRGVEKAFTELRRGLPGVQIDTGVFRLADYVEDSMSNLVLAILGGALLMLLCAGVLLTDWRSAVVAIASAALSLVAAVSVLQVAGATLNTMILAGLVAALALIIDDAVVGSEALLRLLRERSGGSESIAALVHRAVLETRGTAIYGTLVAMLAVVPVFFMEGLAGAFLEPLASAYLLAVAVSALVALTVTPALCVAVGRPRRESVPEPARAARLAVLHAGLLERIARRPRTAAFATAASVLLGAAVLPLLDQSLLPAFRERDLVVDLTTAPGTSPAETQRIAARMAGELRALPGVRSVGAHVGRAVSGDQVVAGNSGQMWVGLDPKEDFDRTVAAVRATVDAYPGVAHDVQFYLRGKVSEVLTGASKPLVVRIYGPARDVLRAKAEEVRAAIASVPGIVDPHVDGEVEEPVLNVKLDLDAAGRAGVRPGDVRRATATVFAGLTVGFLFRDQKIYEVVVQGTPEARQSVAKLRDLWIERSDRQHVRLADIAEVTLTSMPVVIRHEASAPYVDVVAGFAGRDAATVVDEVEDRIEKIGFPLEHHPEVLGEVNEWKDVQQRIVGSCIAAAIAIILLLQACLRSWRLAAIAFVAFPVSLAGGALAALAGGASLTLGSLIGFLAIPGICARNAIVLITRYQRFEGDPAVPVGRPLALRAGGEALAPILAGTVTIVAVMLAFATVGRVAGLEIVAPMAAVVIGGVAASGLFTLLLMPALLGGASPMADRRRATAANTGTQPGELHDEGER
jgi:Cu/Ag efflux pump CusA